MKILFMCVANSSRSQMAEGLARKLFGQGSIIHSAGSEPTKVNPFAILAMKEVGIDISNHHSKRVEDLPRNFLVNLDYVITLCAEEVCPVLITNGKKLHWPFPDPAGARGTPEDQLRLFCTVRGGIQKKLTEFKSQQFLKI